jgi:23S rRNA pseudouridine1911/1915/1917 synthase
MTANRPVWTVGPEDAGLRLDKFLAAGDRLASRARAADALARGKVFLNGAEASMGQAAQLLAAGDAVRVWMDRPGSARPRPRAGRFGPLHIVYEDDALVVVNKPAGVLSVPLERKRGVPSIYDQIEDKFRSHGKRRPLVVHRIDQDTSGLVVFAKDEAAEAELKRQFKRREPERVYWAVVYGVPEPASGIWRDQLVWDDKALIQKQTISRDPRATEAISEYRVIEALGDASLIEVRLRTGRRNQVRIQACVRGHMLVGETRYVARPESLRPIRFPRHALHARRLAFRHPADGRLVEFDAPAPPDLLDLISRLRSRR